MKANVAKITCAVTLAMLVAGGVRAQHDPHAHGGGEDGKGHEGRAGQVHGKHDGHEYGEALMEPGEGHHHRFEDAEKWAAVFESEERNEWQRPEHVLGVLRLPPDAKVADIGASTGYFAVRFARAVPEGRVYGIDIEPDMDRYLRERAEKEGLTNLVSVLGAPDDPRVPEPVDLVFVCNTYHHIGDRTAYFSRLRNKLRPGGRVAIVDYFARELPIGPPVSMKIPAEAVAAELEGAGYRLVLRDDELPYQYILLFEAGDGG